MARCPRCGGDTDAPSRWDWKAGVYVVGFGVIIQTLALVAVIWKSAHG